MADEQKPKSYEEHVQENNRKEQERKERMEKTRIETTKRMEADPAIQKYFEQYNKSSVESFVHSYAHLKMLYMEYGEQHGKMSEEQNLARFEEATNCLRLILLKKLFDLRCRWGANQIKLEGIEVSWDFLPWSEDVFNCPFLEPVTPADIALFIRFAATDDFEPDASRYGWLEYESQRSTTTGDEFCLPEWFYFHNTHTGASQYFALPDLRGQQEEYYRDLTGNESREKLEKKYESGELQRPVMDERPWLKGYVLSEMEDFIRRFEDEGARKKFNGYNSYSSHLHKDEESDDAYYNEQAVEIVHELVSLGRIIPINGNADFRVALLEAKRNFECEQITSSLSVAYDDYLFRLQSKIGFKTDEHADFNKELAAKVKEQILHGRELNGEGRDLEF